MTCANLFVWVEPGEIVQPPTNKDNQDNPNEEALQQTKKGPRNVTLTFLKPYVSLLFFSFHFIDTN